MAGIFEYFKTIFKKAFGFDKSVEFLDWLRFLKKYFSAGSYTRLTCFSWEMCMLMIFGLLIDFLGWGVAHCKAFAYGGHHKHRRSASSVSVTVTHDHRIRALRHCGGPFANQRIKIHKTVMNLFKNKFLREVFEAKGDSITERYEKLHNEELHVFTLRVMLLRLLIQQVYMYCRGP
jgi:hypothetical protein